MLDSGCSIDDSLALVGASTTSSAAQPSLMHWALTGDLAGEPLPRVLRFVAESYRQKAERQQTIWRVVAPTICGVVIGAVLVLGYGLGLFLPVVQMLKDVAMPPGV